MYSLIIGFVAGLLAMLPLVLRAERQRQADRTRLDRLRDLGV